MNNHTLPDIKQTLVLSAPIEEVWKMISTSEGISKWFMPNDFKAEVGYEFHIQSPFGPSPCKVLEIDEPQLIKFSWDTEGWVVSFILKEVGENTELTLIHGGWKGPDEIIAKANKKSSEIRFMMEFGWEKIVQEGLKKAIEG